MTSPVRHLLPALTGTLSLVVGSLAYATGRDVLAVGAAAVFAVVLLVMVGHMHWRMGSNYRQLRAENSALLEHYRRDREQEHTAQLDEEQLLDILDRMTPVITQTVARDWSLNANRITARYEVLERELRGLLDELEERTRGDAGALRKLIDDLEQRTASDGGDDAFMEFTESTRLALQQQTELLTTRLQHLQQTPTTSTVRRIVTEGVSEVDALLKLHDRLEMPPDTPVLGGWALNPRALLRVLELIEEHQPRLVIECGSGASTAYVARALQRIGRGAVLSLEHDYGFLCETQARLERLQLDEVADVRHAPLVELDVRGTTYRWYDTAALADLGTVDMLLVDGPPAATGELARYPALPLLHDHLADDAVVLLDDATRNDEKQTIERWKEEFGYQRVDTGGRELAVLVPAASQWTALK